MASDSSNCPDHFVFRNCNQMKCDVLEHHAFTDHYPVQFQFAFKSRAHPEKLSFRDTSFLKYVVELEKHLFSLQIEPSKISFADKKSSEAFLSLHSGFLEMF